MFKKITSTQNSLIKELIQLKEKSRVRKKTGKFIIEGVREISLAIKGNYEIEMLLVDFSLISEEEMNKTLQNCSSPIEIVSITQVIYKKIALRSTTEGMIALVKAKKHTLEQLKFNNKNPLILVAEAPEKPGNIGALLRTADAAGVDAVLIANPRTDLYNPNIIRSSIGTVFTNDIATGSTSEIISFLKQQKTALYGASLSASVSYGSIDYNQGCAVIVGTEASGLSDEWLANTTKNIIIPMHGTIDSMNVSVSAAVILFEAIRQRNINK